MRQRVITQAAVSLVTLGSIALGGGPAAQAQPAAQAPAIQTQQDPAVTVESLKADLAQAKAALQGARRSVWASVPLARQAWEDIQAWRRKNPGMDTPKPLAMRHEEAINRVQAFNSMVEVAHMRIDLIRQALRDLQVAT